MLASLTFTGLSQVATLGGNWYMEGTGQKCEIIQNVSKLVFINEAGSRSNGYIKADGNVVATDWGNLHGNLNEYHNRISWSNNTNWFRKPAPNLEGEWLLGDASDNDFCYIKQNGNKLMFINEHKDQSAGYLENANVLVATDWGNLKGTISGDQNRINWANGSWWHRRNLPDISGIWLMGGSTEKCTIVQESKILTFVNEKGGKSSGYFKDANTVVASDWGNLEGKITNNQNRINWGNSTWWER